MQIPLTRSLPALSSRARPHGPLDGWKNFRESSLNKHESASQNVSRPQSGTCFDPFPGSQICAWLTVSQASLCSRFGNWIFPQILNLSPSWSTDIWGHDTLHLSPFGFLCLRLSLAVTLSPQLSPPLTSTPPKISPLDGDISQGHSFTYNLYGFNATPKPVFMV